MKPSGKNLVLSKIFRDNVTEFRVFTFDFPHVAKLQLNYVIDNLGRVLQETR